MNRIFFLFLFSACSLFPSSYGLVDVECYQKNGAIEMRLYSGTGHLRKYFDWEKRVFKFNKKLKMWQCDTSSFCLEDLVKALKKINDQEINEPSLNGNKTESCLSEMMLIAQMVKYRDPVRFTTFYDNVLACAGIRNDLVSLLIPS